MKTISVTVNEADYAAIQAAAQERSRSAAQLIREAMSLYRRTVLESRPRLDDLPVLAGHHALGPVPARADIYADVFGESGAGE